MCLLHDEPRKDSDHLYGGAEGWDRKGSQAEQRAGNLKINREFLLYHVTLVECGFDEQLPLIIFPEG